MAPVSIPRQAITCAARNGDELLTQIIIIIIIFIIRLKFIKKSFEVCDKPAGIVLNFLDLLIFYIAIKRQYIDRL